DPHQQIVQKSARVPCDAAEHNPEDESPERGQRGEAERDARAEHKTAANVAAVAVRTEQQQRGALVRRGERVPAATPEERDGRRAILFVTLLELIEHSTRED